MYSWHCITQCAYYWCSTWHCITQCTRVYLLLVRSQTCDDWLVDQPTLLITVKLENGPGTPQFQYTNAQMVRVQFGYSTKVAQVHHSSSTIVALVGTFQLHYKSGERTVQFLKHRCIKKSDDGLVGIANVGERQVWIEPIYITEHQLVDKDCWWLTDGWTMMIMVTTFTLIVLQWRAGDALFTINVILHKSNTTQLVRKLTPVYKSVIHTVAPVGQQRL